MSTNLVISVRSCCFTALGTVHGQACTGLIPLSINCRLIGPLLNSPNVPSKRCHIFGVIKVIDVVPLH
jgi:hypothetical protein